MATGERKMDEPRSAAESITWQADHCRNNDAPATARVVLAMLALLDGDTRCGRRMADWQGLTAEAATPLRLAAGLHHLALTGADMRLVPVYAGEIDDQRAVDALVAAMVRDHDDELIGWFDSPPQTNEAGRSGAIMAALLWLSQRLGHRFELLEIGASAGANTMIERYRYLLGDAVAGPADSRVTIAPEWRGNAPSGTVEIAAIAGCDRSPIDLSDDASALRLKSYVWPEMRERLARIDAVIACARERLPDVTRGEAADWVEARLVMPQAKDTTRVLYHSIVWQYLPVDSRARIEAAMASAGAQATLQQPLAWIAIETNRQTFSHEIRVRYWPGGEDGTLLGYAHAHGGWVEWLV